MPALMTLAPVPPAAVPSIGYGWVAGVLAFFAVLLVAVVVVAKAAEKSRRAAEQGVLPRRDASERPGGRR